MPVPSEHSDRFDAALFAGIIPVKTRHLSGVASIAALPVLVAMAISVPVAEARAEPHRTSPSPARPSLPHAAAAGRERSSILPPRNSADPSHATVVRALRRALVGIATLDGVPITDVQLRFRCTTAFVTAKGATVIDWSKVGNFAGRIDGKQGILPIRDGRTTHLFAMPEGDGFRGVDGSMGLLADDCGEPM
jgi:hypothetical protein